MLKTLCRQNYLWLQHFKIDKEWIFNPTCLLWSMGRNVNFFFLRFDRLFGPLRITYIIIEEWTSNRFDKCYFTLLNTHIYYGDSWYINQLTNDGDSWYIHQLPRLFQWGSWTISSSFSTKFQELYIPPPHRPPFWVQLPSCATTHYLSIYLSLLLQYLK